MYGTYDTKNEELIVYHKSCHRRLKRTYEPSIIHVKNVQIKKHIISTGILYNKFVWYVALILKLNKRTFYMTL